MKLREVMVVDDNDADLTWNRLVLEESRVADSVQTFGTGRAAFTYLERAGVFIDAVLLDINMPEKSGFEFLERLVALEPHLEPPAVVMQSSSGGARDRLRAASFPCVNGHLVKPLDEERVRCVGGLAGRQPSW